MEDRLDEVLNAQSSQGLEASADAASAMIARVRKANEGLARNNPDALTERGIWDAQVERHSGGTNAGYNAFKGEGKGIATGPQEDA